MNSIPIAVFILPVSTSSFILTCRSINQIVSDDVPRTFGGQLVPTSLQGTASLEFEPKGVKLVLFRGRRLLP
jgi:hypothetical protein